MRVKVVYLLSVIVLFSSSLCSASLSEEDYMAKRSAALNFPYVCQLPSADVLKASFESKGLLEYMGGEEACEKWANKEIKYKQLWRRVECHVRSKFDQSGLPKTDEAKKVLIDRVVNILLAVLDVVETQ